MLHFILGRAGSGKTTLLYTKLKKAAAEGKRVLLLVPEQASFEAEKQLSAFLSPSEFLQVEVLSFTRLCNLIFREYGGLAGSYIDQTAKALLMSIAMEQLRDQLKFYSGSNGTAAFTEAMVEQMKEFKNAGVFPDQLACFAKSTPDERLQEKTAEIAEIYALYQALIDRSYADPDDDLPRAVKVAEEQPFFAGSVVFVDSFMTFMAAEYQMLEQVIAGAEECWFSFTADSFEDYEGGMGVFSPVKATMHRLLRMAKSRRVQVEPPTILTHNRRFQYEDLAFVEEHILQLGGEVFAGEPEHVQVIKAEDAYDEVEFVAEEIWRLVREEGYRFRDIAVIARDIVPYTSQVESVFSTHHIPYFMDKREDAETKPLISAVLTALSAVRAGYNTDEIIKLGKSALLAFDPAELGELENYCFTWGIQGALWLAPFKNHPEGMVERFSDADHEKLQRINVLREKLITPLIHLKYSLTGCDGTGFAKAVYKFLTEINAGEGLRAFAASSQQPQRMLEESAALWDKLMELLDTYSTILKEQYYPLSRFIELFRLAVSSLDYGEIPQTMDQVIVGMADRIRPNAPKAVFLIGVNDGVFPAAVSTSGLFSDSERVQLIEGGVEISQSLEKKSVFELYFAYFAATTPSQRLTLSYPCADQNGGILPPSRLIEEVCTLFHCRPKEIGRREGIGRITGEESAFLQLARHFRQDTPFTATLLEYFESTRRKSQIEAMNSCLAGTNSLGDLKNSEKARALYGNMLRLSPSRVEQFHQCPLRFFCSSGLKLKPRRAVEFNPMESGTIIHYVLQMLLSSHTPRELNTMEEAALKTEIRDTLNGYLADRIDNLQELPARLRYLFTRLVTTLYRLIRHLAEEFCQSLFTPVAFEMPIRSGADGQVSPTLLTTPSGVKVMVEGVVDRVDIMESGGKKYVRVVDYKSGRKKFELTDVLYGLNMQMLIYLFSIWQNPGEMFGNALPAGVLYLPARVDVVPARRETNRETVEKEHLKNLRMNGLLLEDPLVLRGMEQEMKGVFIPVSSADEPKLGQLKAVASLAQMGELKRHVQTVLTRMAEQITAGKAAPAPVQSGDYSPCDNCDFWGICRPDDTLPVIQIEPKAKGELYSQLEVEEHG